MTDTTELAANLEHARVTLAHFGQRVRTKREDSPPVMATPQRKSHMGLGELAEHIGTSKQILSDIERGVRMPDKAQLATILAWLAS